MGGVGGAAGADAQNGPQGGFGGVGGNGGHGAAVYGGAISASDNAVNVTLDGTSGANLFMDNAITSGTGGAGGAGGANNSQEGGISDGGDGGPGGDAFGGGLSYFITAGNATNSVTVLSSAFTSNTIVAGNGGAGGAATNELTTLRPGRFGRHDPRRRLRRG